MKKVGTRQPESHWRTAPLEFGWISKHQFLRFFRKLFGVLGASLGHAEDDAGKLQAGGLYGLGTLADLGCDLLPSIVKSLPDSLKLVRIKRGVGDKLVSFHAVPTHLVELKLAGMPRKNGLVSLRV